MSTHPVDSPESSVPVIAAPILANTFANARALIASGRVEEGRILLRYLIETAPAYDEPWLQLLALEPEPAEEVKLLDGFLQHHAHHRFAKAFQARLQEMRIVAMLSDPQAVAAPDNARRAMRLGDYLIMKEWVTLGQVEQALAEQRRLRASGVDVRLGTLLLINGHVGPEQLADAFSATETKGFGEFGDYLVRTQILTPEQVGAALARQASIAADLDREYLRKLATYQKRERNPLLSWRSVPKRKVVPRLGEVMVSMGMLTHEQVDRLLRERHDVFHASLG